jgi:hypothetical protein
MAATAAFGLGAISSASSAYSQSQAIKAQSYYQSGVSKLNAQLAEMKSDDAIKRGGVAARDYQKEVDSMISDQRVAYAGQGVDVNFGSASDIQRETRLQGALDGLKIKNNAYLEAWGYKSEAINDTAAGRFTEVSGKNNANNTLITGGMQSLTYGLQAYASYNKGKSSDNKLSTASTQTPVSR